MKLLIVTAVEEFEKEILRLFREANIENFSGSEIDGFESAGPLVRTTSWFPGKKGGVESTLFFSFTEERNIEAFFGLIKEFNKKLETNNPIKAAVVPIEKFI